MNHDDLIERLEAVRSSYGYTWKTKVAEDAIEALRELTKPVDGDVQQLAETLRDAEYFVEADYLERLARQKEMAQNALKDSNKLVEKQQAEIERVKENNGKMLDALTERDALKVQVERLKKDWYDDARQLELLEEQRDQLQNKNTDLNKLIDLLIDDKKKLQADYEDAWNLYQNQILDNQQLQAAIDRLANDDFFVPFEPEALGMSTGSVNWYESEAEARIEYAKQFATKPDTCEHGKGLNDYCEPCGRIHNDA